MKKVGLIANKSKTDVKNILEKIQKFSKEQNEYEISYEETLKELMFDNQAKYLSSYDLVNWCDVLVVLGGDGTLLSVIPFLKENNPDIIGVNLGHLGFLTEFNSLDFEEALLNWCRGKYKLKHRMMLEVILPQEKQSQYVLNEVVISKGSFARMLSLDIYISGSYFAYYRADGLILSTPTGSTAYSLSSGGPIVEPEMSLIVMTPICPHTLSNRPLLISDKRDIMVVLKSSMDDVGITLDGRKNYAFQPEEKILVRKSQKSIRMVQGQGQFFDIVKEKLDWTGAISLMKNKDVSSN